MDESINNGSASENGENKQEMDENGQPAPPPADPRREEGKAVPYSRFQEVNAKRKAAEDTLAGIVDELCADVPEDMRPLIPNLPPADKVKWLREARSKGLFQPASASSPDSKRPTAKPSEDLRNLSPVAMMARGYK